MQFTVADFAGQSGGGKSTVDHYLARLGRLERRIGKPLAEVTRKEVLELKAFLRGRKSGPHDAALLRMFYRAAEAATDDLSYLKLARLLDLKQKARRLAPADILTVGDVNALVAAARTLRDRAIVVTLWNTGVRPGEVGSLRVGDVRRGKTATKDGTEAPYFAIFFRQVKVAGEEHSGYVLEGVDHLAAWIAAHPNPRADAPLFPSNRGRPLGEDGIYDVIKSLARRSELSKKIWPHLFRHSRATHLLAHGFTEAQTKILLGWTPGSNMLSRYSHLVSKDGLNALLKLNGFAAPEHVDVERLLSAEADLVPVAPMPADPFAKAQVASASWDPAAAREIRAYLEELKGTDPLTLEAISYVSRGVTLDELRAMAAKVQAATKGATS